MNYMTAILRCAAAWSLVVGACSTTTVHAQGMPSLEMMQLAQNLGTVLAGEKVCGFSYDQDAIAAFIGEHVPADNLDFAPMLSTMVMGEEFTAGQMTESTRTAQCAAVAQSARHYGFME